jgi:hypothetical protein
MLHVSKQSSYTEELAYLYSFVMTVFRQEYTPVTSFAHLRGMLVTRSSPICILPAWTPPSGRAPERAMQGSAAAREPIMRLLMDSPNMAVRGISEQRLYSIIFQYG